MTLAGGLATNQDLAYTQGFRSLHAWVDSQVISAPSRKCVAWLRPPPSSGPGSRDVVEATAATFRMLEPCLVRIPSRCAASLRSTLASSADQLMSRRST